MIYMNIHICNYSRRVWVSVGLWQYGVCGSLGDGAGVGVIHMHIYIYICIYIYIALARRRFRDIHEYIHIYILYACFSFCRPLAIWSSWLARGHCGWWSDTHEYIYIYIYIYSRSVSVSVDLQQCGVCGSLGDGAGDGAINMNIYSCVSMYIYILGVSQCGWWCDAHIHVCIHMDVSILVYVCTCV